MQEEGYLPPLQRSGSGTERAAAGRSAQAIRGPRRCFSAGVVSAEDWGNLLSRARDGVPQEAFLLTARERHDLLQLFLAALRVG